MAPTAQQVHPHTNPAVLAGPVAPLRHLPRTALRRIPFAGPTLDYLADPLGMMRRQLEEHGPVSESPFLGSTWTILVGPDACDHALRNPDKAFASGPGWGELVGPFFDGGLMLQDFEEHHRSRRLMQHAFTRDRLARYAAQLSPAVARGIGAWELHDGFLAYPALKQLTLDLATQVFLGADPDGRSDADRAELQRVNEAFIACVQAATAFVRLPIPGTRWGKALAGRKLLEEVLGRRLAELRAQPGGPDGDDLMSVLCRLAGEDGDTFSDRDVVNHMVFLLMAAHDTSTLTTSTILDQLGRHPEWQERVRAESMALPEHPTLDELDSLTSLDLVIKEALRLVPPVPVLARRTVKETEVLGVRVPADQLVAVMLHHSHHDPAVWTDPDRFDPERFAEHRREDKRHRAAWEPFGGGVHKCLGLFFAGMEIKLLVHHLVRRASWTTPAEGPTPLTYLSLPVPADGLPLDLRATRATTEGAPA